MSNRLIDVVFDVFKNYLGEVLLTLTILFLVLCRRWFWKQRDKQKFKAEKPIWSPGHKKLCVIFSTNGKKELNIYDVSTGKKTKLDISIAEGQTPTWSPDGTKIALVSDQDGNKEIYVVNADGSNLRRLTDDPVDDFFPEWSADGKKITFVSRKNGTVKISSVTIDD
jgi:Tol biopolymer transport system component